MAQKIIRTGLVGYGLGGRCFHAPFIAQHPGYELVRIVERTKRESAERYPKAIITSSIEELVADPSLDLVVITTPNPTHYPFAVKALEAGKHVVLDKPMTVSSEEATALIRLAQEKERCLSVYQNRRYASDARTIKKIIQQQLLGPLLEFEAQYNRYRPQLKNNWKESEVPGSGILYDLGPHLIDLSLSLFGSPHTITADIRKQRPGTLADDYFDLRLDYGSMKVILKAGMIVREQGPRYQIHGTQGSFIKYGDDPQDQDARAGKLPSDPEWGLEPESQYGLLHTEHEGKLIHQKIPSEKGDFGIYYQQLYDTIVHGAPLKEKPEHGHNVIKVIEYARLSHELKHTLTLHGLIPTSYE